MLAQTACLGATAAYHAVVVGVGVCLCVSREFWSVVRGWDMVQADSIYVDGGWI